MSEEVKGSIPRGTLLTDNKKNKWIIGSFIKIIGCGEFYEAAPHKDKPSTDYPVIIRMELKNNTLISTLAPLYCFTSQKDFVRIIMEIGTYEFNTKVYYFYVLKKCQIESALIFRNNNRQFSISKKYQVAFQTACLIWMVHSQRLAHGNITEQNLLILDQSHVCLTNFALASPYLTRGVETKEAHIGSIRYSSRDHHTGVLTMRGDFEMLLYNVIHWLHGILPWDNLNDPIAVQKLKEDAFKNTNKFLRDCFKAKIPAAISKFMALLASMDQLDKPDYTKIYSIFIEEAPQLHHLRNFKITYDKKKKEYILTVKDEMTIQDSPVVANTDRLNQTNPEAPILQKQQADGVTVRRSLRLMEKPKQRVATNFVEREMETAAQEKILRSRKRKSIVTDDESKQVDELNSSTLANPPTPGCRSSPPTRVQSKRFCSSVSPGSSSGISSQLSTQNGYQFKDLSRLETSVEWEDEKYLDIWLKLMEKSLGSIFSQISSEPQTIDGQLQEVLNIRDQYSIQQPRLDSLLEKLSTDSARAQELNGIVHRWRNQLGQIEERGRKLNDIYLGQLRDILQGISSDLDKLKKDPDEQLLRMIESLLGRLDDQRTLLDNAKSMGDQLCRAFNDPVVNSNLRAKAQDLDKLYHDLQQKMDFRKVEVERSLREIQQLYESCKEVQVLLDVEFDAMPEKPFILTDRVALQQQLEYYEKIHQRVMRREKEVTELLSKVREILAKSKNLEAPTIQQRYLHLTQSKCWDRLKKCSHEICSRLRACVKHSEKYYEAKIQFEGWLDKTETKLENLRSASLKEEDDVKKLLDELSLLSDEVLKKSVDLEQNINLGNIFVDSCDKDENNVVENEIINMKDRWTKLDAGLLQLADKYKQFADLNKDLCDLKDKLKKYEAGVIPSCDAWRETDKYLSLRERIEKLLKETVTLQESLDVLRQQAIGLVRKQDIKIDRFLDEMNGLTLRVVNLKAKFGDNLNEIIEMDQKRCDRKELERNADTNTLQEQVDQKPLKLLKSFSLLPGETIDLTSE